MYYTERITKTKKRRRPANEASYSMGSLVYVDHQEYHLYIVCCQFIEILGRAEWKASETWNIHQFHIETRFKVGQP